MTKRDAVIRYIPELNGAQILWSWEASITETEDATSNPTFRTIRSDCAFSNKDDAKKFAELAVGNYISALNEENYQYFKPGGNDDTTS